MMMKKMMMMKKKKTVAAADKIAFLLSLPVTGHVTVPSDFVLVEVLLEGPFIIENIGLFKLRDSLGTGHSEGKEIVGV
jgi:hypothetical protein